MTKQTKGLLIVALQKDISRYDIISSIVEICYFMKDYASVYIYFKKLKEIKDALKLDIDFVKIYPLIENMKDFPDFRKIMNDIDTKFWEWPMQIKYSL